MTKVWAFFSGIGGRFLSLLAGVGGILLSLFLSFKWGKASERADRAEAFLKQKEKNKVKGGKLEKEYENISASDVANRLNNRR
jgi:hypothetical protein